MKIKIRTYENSKIPSKGTKRALFLIIVPSGDFYLLISNAIIVIQGS